MRKLVKSLLHALTVAAAMLMLLMVVTGSALYFAGIITDAKIADVAKVVDGRLESVPEDQVVQEATLTPREIKSAAELQEAVEEWRRQQRLEETALAARREAVEAMVRELDTVRAEILAREQALRVETVAFEQAKAAELAATRDAGFQEAVKTYSVMEPRDVAQMLAGLHDLDVVRYLKAFKVAFRAEVLAEMKKLDVPARPGDISRAARLLELISAGRADAVAEAAYDAVR